MAVMAVAVRANLGHTPAIGNRDRAGPNGPCSQPDTTGAAVMSANLLGQETSPYLLQHKDNPVHWQPWGEAALAQARATDKPILLSIGYAACHWCHVMAHESFEMPEIAAIMNEHFVNIKVDREERPDLDAIYQTALALLGQPGGWPLTMFLTPAGEPFWGGTYFPPRASFGRPSLPEVLHRLAEVYGADREAVTKNTTALLGALNQIAAGAQPETLSVARLNTAATDLLGQMDPVHGGLRGAPKFPQVPQLELLWRAGRRLGDKRYHVTVDRTLTHMCQGGIYDHLGGGFARYSVDERWLVPHFEKMLYDNAQLVDLLCLGWQAQGSALFARRIAETIAWVLGEMRTDNGAFAATLDADSDGEEGRFYVWTKVEIDAVLGAEAEFFDQAYDVTPSGNWEGRAILNRLHRPEPLSDADEGRLAAARTRLLEVRETRVRPARDDKLLTDWNGLMIAALARAGALFARDDWLRAARTAFAVITDALAIPDTARLYHCWRTGRAETPALLDDYAAMSRAALTLHEITGDDDYLDHAARWVGILDEDFLDRDHGGYYFTPQGARDLIVRTRNAADAATPAGNGLMSEVLIRLYHLTGEARYRDRADALFSAFAGALDQNGWAFASLLNGFDTALSPVQVAIIGDRDEAACRALIDAALAAPCPSRILQVTAPDADLPTGHPAFGKGLVDGAAAAYICRGTTCSPPLTDADDLVRQLKA